MQIAQQNILITGANRGIGLALAKMCAREGAHLHLVLRKLEPELSTELSKSGALGVRQWQADLSQLESIAKLVSELQEVPIDILVNNAGLLTGGLLEEQPLDEILAMFQVNLIALVQLTRGLLPAMIKRRSGKIVNNSSISALMHFPCASTYGASKAAVLAFTNSLELELTGTGVSTLCLVTPGIRTRMYEDISTKYGKNLEIPDEAISPAEYAERVKAAILSDQTHLYPKGLSAIGLGISKYLPGLFAWESKRRFHRQ